MKTGAIIFSRMSSNRLPGKAMLDINGRCLLGRVIDRANFIEGIDSLIIATSNDSSDDVIEEFALKEKLQIFRGSLNNVLSRAVSACEHFRLDSFVRICGDRPFFDPKLATDLLSKYKASDCEVLTTSFPKTVPAGLTIEILSYKVLKNIIRKVSNIYDREHITNFIYKNATDFKILGYDNDIFSKYLKLNISVDTLEQLRMVAWIARNTDRSDGSFCDSKEILKLAQLWQVRGDEE